MTPQRRTDLLALGSIAGTIAGALGALASGVPTLLQRALGLGTLASFRPVFIAYAVLAVLTALLYSRLSSRVEVQSGTARWTNPFTLPSRGRIFTLAGLFTVDSFGTGLIVQSLASYWFFTRFGLQPGSLGALFFASSVLTAISLWVAARLAPTDRTTEHDRLHPHSIEPVSDRRAVCARRLDGYGPVVAASLLRADGRANEPVLHHGSRRTRRTTRHGECHDRDPERRARGRPVGGDSAVDRDQDPRALPRGRHHQNCL